VLGLDHEIVRKGIKAKYEFEQGEAAEYLEKIVQIPFHLPPLDQNRVMRYVVDQYADVHHICATAPEVFCKGLEPNPRKVKRALNIYRTLWDLAEVRVAAWEMDPVDPELLAKMVVIQSRFGDLNRHLRENPLDLPTIEAYATRDEIESSGSEELVYEYDESKGRQLNLKSELRREDVKKLIEDKVPEDHCPALNQLFAAGEQRFRHVPAGGLVSYIYLTGTAEGISDLMRPSRRERDALLSNDRERVREEVENILARAATDEERNRLWASYHKRLQAIRETPDLYSESELLSAGYAQAWLEIDGAKGVSKATLRFSSDENILEIPPGNKGYVSGLLEILFGEELSPEEKEIINEQLNKFRTHYEPEMTFVPAGPFLMGTTEEHAQELIADGYREEWAMREVPQHTVELSEYQIGKYPVTNQEYQAFIRDSDQAPPRDWDGDQYPEGVGDHPVVNVSWHDAQAYCQWLGEKKGKAYRLPTEAEWEKAARGGFPSPSGRGGTGEGAGVRVYPWGDEWDSDKCNSGENDIGDTTPVGQYSPQGDSPYGCADMAGNVWEWCADWFDEDAYKNREDGIRDPQGPEKGEYRVVRGGSWNLNRRVARVSARDLYHPDDRWYGAGFRLCVPPS
jgi:formylglycine-generating enzyme required for sulfatase activity